MKTQGLNPSLDFCLLVSCVLFVKLIHTKPQCALHLSEKAHRMLIQEENQKFGDLSLHYN